MLTAMQMQHSYHAWCSQGRVMDFVPIRSEADYKAALTHIEMLMHSCEKFSDADLLKSLRELVEHYERTQYRIKQPKRVATNKGNTISITLQETL